MATNIRIISARDFVKATPEGRFDFEETKQFLINVASASNALNDHEILIDTRRTDAEMTPSELWHLAAELEPSPGGPPFSVPPRNSTRRGSSRSAPRIADFRSARSPRSSRRSSG